jgi:1-acyl-sn-glycerol-3-phosphate acyltransferase
VTFYRFARAVVGGLCRLVFRVQVRGAELVPASGACILAPSHRSNLDTPFLALVTRRRIRFMAKQELFSKEWSAKLFGALGGVPVERGSATARSALKAIRAALEAGEPAAVFPEGTRRKGPEIAELFDGAAYLAVKLGVPIVPVGIGGSEAILASGQKLPKLHRVAIVVGPPINPPAGATTRKRSDLAAITAELRVELQRLFDEAQALAG